MEIRIFDLHRLVVGKIGIGKFQHPILGTATSVISEPFPRGYRHLFGHDRQCSGEHRDIVAVEYVGDRRFWSRMIADLLRLTRNFVFAHRENAVRRHTPEKNPRPTIYSFSLYERHFADYTIILFGVVVHIVAVSFGNIVHLNGHGAFGDLANAVNAENIIIFQSTRRSKIAALAVLLFDRAVCGIERIDIFAAEYRFAVKYDFYIKPFAVAECITLFQKFGIPGARPIEHDRFPAR